MVDVLFHGSMVLVIAWLVLGGLGVPLPEDVALLAAGTLAHRGAAPLPLAFASGLVGVVLGDALLFFTARRLGPAAYRRPLFRKLLPAARRRRIEQLFRRRGGLLVFGARYIVGFRAAVYALAGIHGMRPRRFLLCDALAASVSVSATVSLGYFAANQLDRVRADVTEVRHILVLAVIVLAAGALSWWKLRRYRSESRHEQNS